MRACTRACTQALNEASAATRYIPPVWLAPRQLIKTGLLHCSNTDPLQTAPARQTHTRTPFPSFFGALRNPASPLHFLPSRFHSFTFLSRSLFWRLSHGARSQSSSEFLPDTLITFEAEQHLFFWVTAFDNAAYVSLKRNVQRGGA